MMCVRCMSVAFICESEVRIYLFFPLCTYTHVHVAMLITVIANLYKAMFHACILSGTSAVVVKFQPIRLLYWRCFSHFTEIYTPS